jgi:hypothetical protein
VVVAAACGGLVWHGGFREGAQLALAAVALCTLALWPAAWPEPLWIAGGLSLAALADAAAFALHGGSLGTLAAGLAVPALLAVAAAEPAALDRWLLPALAVTAATVATAGLAGLVLRSPPLAERIAGLWRAGGTLEYPPALGLVCVCGLAAVLALHAAGVLDLGPALVAGGILVAGAAATFDRVTAIEVLGLLALCVVRLPDARTASIALALGAAIAGAIALAAAGDGDAVSRHLRHGPISSREAVWGDAATAISERPFTGRGPGAFPDLQAQRHPRHPAYAHDAALEQGVDAGLVAAAGTAAALAAMLLAGLRGMASTDPRRLAAGVVATAVAASGLYDFTWSFAPIVLIGALAALALGPTYAATGDRARSSSP